MTIKTIDATHVGINGVSHLLSGLTVILRGMDHLQVIDNATGNDLVPNTLFSNLTDGNHANAKFATQAAFLTEMGVNFGLTAAGTKKALFVANTAGAPSAGYVQAEAVATLTELRAVKTSLINAGLMKSA